MYIIIDKKSNIIIHINRAPLLQKLTGAEIYFDYNENNHTIGKTDDNNIKEKIVVNKEFPNELKIENDFIYEKSLEEKINENIIILSSEQKFDDGNIVEKTTDEKYEDEVITYEEYTNLKMEKLRLIRNNSILTSIWIQERHLGEREGLEKEITTKSPSLTEEQYNQWLLYWEKLRDLPDTVNIDNYKYDDIREDNLNIFPIQPS